MTTKCLYLFIVLNLFISASAQSPVDLLNNYSVSYPAENVYLQTDNSYYAITDTIWFKTYLKANLFPSDYNKNLYVDWYDASGELMAHQSYPIMESGAAGQFVIPANIKGNHLSVLAYTKGCLMMGTISCFIKQFQCVQQQVQHLTVQLKLLQNLKQQYTFFQRVVI
ncbi:MAG: hypothetical protein JST21_00450 [Bacteroidetes bacterium]|nr:hypothetical protein [Bacteroidota bacterium]